MRQGVNSNELIGRFLYHKKYLKISFLIFKKNYGYDMFKIFHGVKNARSAYQMLSQSNNFIHALRYILHSFHPTSYT